VSGLPSSAPPPVPRGSSIAAGADDDGLADQTGKREKPNHEFGLQPEVVHTKIVGEGGGSGPATRYPTVKKPPRSLVPARRASGRRTGQRTTRVEQGLPAPEHDRRDRDRQLFHVSGAQRLADDVRSTHDEDVFAPRRLARQGDGLIQPVHEGEFGACGGVLRSMRHDEERHAEQVVATPRLRRLVGVAAADDGADASGRLVEDLLPVM
jgi:hypothetical protein